jgi:[ribosomal protein S5]-alanine N-acetyltransferase
MDEEGARQFVLEMAHVQTMIAGDWIQLAVAESSSNTLLGDLGLYLEADGSAGELGFTLARSAQGHGHAVRAARQAVLLMFAASDAQVVRAVTDVRNIKSVRVLERVGFLRVEEREAVFKGEPCAEFVYVYRRADALRF